MLPLGLNQLESPKPYLLPISIDGIACNPDTIGGTSGVNGDRKPTDHQDSRRGSWFSLDIQWGVRQAWEKWGTRRNNVGFSLIEMIATSLRMHTKPVSLATSTYDPASRVLGTPLSPHTYLLEVW